MVKVKSFNNVEIATFQEAKKNNPWCGDAIFYVETEKYFICAVSDGLGSGRFAYEASQLVINYLQENHNESLATLMETCNKLLVNKRGVVLSIVKIDYTNKEIIYSNIGNISCIFYTFDGVLTRTIPKRGFLCGRKFSFATKHIPYEKGMRFIIFTDGIELQPTMHSTIAREKNISEVITFVKQTAAFKEDDITFLAGDILK